MHASVQSLGLCTGADGRSKPKTKEDNLRVKFVGVKVGEG